MILLYFEKRYISHISCDTVESDIRVWKRVTDMEPVSMLFLQALRASLEDRTVDWETDIERETWDALFAMAASHSVLPMIYAAVVRCPAAQTTC